MAPVDNSPASNMGGFELICSLTSNEIIPVHKYKSVNTGLTVFIAEVEGPVVCGYLGLATEAFDDDGLPHTLEHLIFLGSENYPYKGILDLLANRCLASGTNACTDVDNTFYTMETVGSEGFLTLLPVYIDHILYPTLKDSAFITEVHHITGEGEDAGVVYCEMQGKENVGEYLVHNELKRAIYPGKCGYKSNTGGELKNLRESTNNEKVRKYHEEFYRPENLCIIITGQVKHADVFKALQPIEEKILAKGDRGPFTRPWQGKVPPFPKNVDMDIYYPCNDEDNGLVYIGWRGPSAISGRSDLLACTLLLKYLTDTSASPLQQEFVEIEDPFASDVRFSLSENSESLLYLMFENVPKPKVSKISVRLMNVLKDIAKDESKIDMQRMNTVIHRHILETLSNIESSPHDSVAFMIIGDFLFGNSKEDLDTRLNEIESLKKLKLKPVTYWIELLNKYFIQAPSAVMKGIPSIDKQQELADIEQKRVSEQIKKLGPEGLKKKDQELQKSIVENETPIPDETLTSVPIPSTDSINFHHIKSYTTESAEQHPRFNVDKLPFYTYLHHVNTNFVYMFVVMDTSEVSLERRPYIPLILEAILECPVLRDGKLIPYETVVSELEMDTIAVSTRIGIENTSRFSCGAYSHNAIFALQLELAKYSKGVRWIKDLLYRSQLISERLKIIASKIINDVAQMKRKGKKVVDDLMKSLIYKKESNHFNASMLRQQQFLTKMLERLNTENGAKEVLAEIDAVRSILTATKNMALYMAVNIDRLAIQVPDVYEPWKEFSDADNSTKSKLHVVQDYELINPLSEINLNGCVTGLGCIESAFFLQCSRGIKDYQHPDLPPLLVCLQYLTQLEGPMWRQIRGQGFAYSYDIYTKPNEGLLYLIFYRATNVVAAYKETKTIVDNHLSENKWESLLFESAKSSLIYEIVQGEKSVGDMVVKSLLSYFKQVPHDYNLRMVKNISAVTMKDIERVAPQYLKPLFEPSSCKTTIVCHPSKSSEIVKVFKEWSHDLKLYNSLEETYLNSW
ncbi:uncharacterized protein C05D11.1 [Nasonia vitripennis]|uniref:Presequence protease, mitochondrial n=1 Tax=Nasonia vitripennis TaxID=7425 RepID=A0A7M7G4T9_NASVI|nr:uncharacterized protein C05D11.1 [Nasonia vitripennis]